MDCETVPGAVVTPKVLWGGKGRNPEMLCAGSGTHENLRERPTESRKEEKGQRKGRGWMEVERDVGNPFRRSLVISF